LEAIENLLTPAFNPEHDCPAVGLRHGRKQMLGHRIHTPFDAPLDRKLFIHHALADRFNAFWLQQEMIVDKIDGPVAAFFEVLEYVHHMLGSTRAPLAFVENRNVAEYARPRTASGCLHRRKPVHREYGGHVKRHRFYKVEREAFAIGEGPL